MINLIRNEFTKIFRKKAIWILGIIIIIMSIIMNVITKRDKDRQNSYYRYSEEYISYIDEELAKLDPNKPSDNAEYIDLISGKETEELVQKCADTSWKAEVVRNYISQDIREVNSYKYGMEKNEELLKTANQKYEESMQKLENNDWKYFAQKQLDDVTKQIKDMEQARSKKR